MADQDPHWFPGHLRAAILAIVIVSAFSHVRRVRLIAGKVNASTLANRQRRQIEVPFEAGEAFDLLDAAIRELPGIEEVHSARDSLQVRAKLQRIDPYGGKHRVQSDPLAGCACATRSWPRSRPATAPAA